MGAYLFVRDVIHSGSLLGWLSLLCLAIGIGLGLQKRNKALIYYAIPYVLSELLITSAILFPVSLSDLATERIIWLIQGLQFVAIAFALFKSRRNYVPALCLTTFVVFFLLYTNFVSAMSLSGTYL